MKQVKLISILTISIFALSLLAPMVSAVGTDAYASPSPTPAVMNQSTTNGIESSLVQLRKDTEDFKANKQLEQSETANAAKEKTSAKRKAAQDRADAARKIKDEKRKAVLIRLLDIQIKQLGNTKERVAKMPNIKSDLKIQLNTSIDAAVAALTAKKAEVSAATTSGALKKLAQDIKDLFKTKRDIVKQIVDAILASKTDNAITAAEGRLADLKVKIAELKAAGQDTSALDSLLAIAESKIAAANTKAGKEDLKGAINDLKEAYNNMKKALAKVEVQPSVTPTPTPTATPTPTPTVTPTPTPSPSGY